MYNTTQQSNKRSYSSRFEIPSFQKFIRSLLKIKVTETGFDTVFSGEAKKALDLRGKEGAMECAAMVKIANEHLKERTTTTSHSTASRNYDTVTRQIPRRTPTRSLPAWCHNSRTQSGIRNKLRLLRTDLRNAHYRSQYIKFPDELRKKILDNIDKTLSMPAYQMAHLGDQVLRSVETG
ncbi:MAG: hypothetical protein IIA77_04995 [Proteobacteria bacterium]|nr:hypothetical protein [Pseudomonadota bacterium]